MRHTILCALFILSSACATKIAGSLVDETGRKLISDVGKVNITRLDGQNSIPFQETISITSDGRFETASNIEPGKYLVEALVPGYKPVSTRIHVEESKNLTLALTPLPRIPTTTIRTNMNLDVGRGSGAATINPPSL